MSRGASLCVWCVCINKHYSIINLRIFINKPHLDALVCYFLLIKTVTKFHISPHKTNMFTQ